MEKIKCKECGKLISKKAEICPNCGCRVKSNIIKIAIICLIVIIVLICGYFGIKQIKNKLDNDKRVKQQKIEEKNNNKINKEETELIESYLGKYNLTYNTSLFNKDHPIFELKNEINVIKQCDYKLEDGHTNTEKMVDCISIENAKTIPYLSNIGEGYTIYKYESENIFYFSMRKIISKNNSQDASNETMKELELYGYYICFSGNPNELEQVECPKKIFENRQPNDTLGLGYDFKLTKIK